MLQRQKYNLDKRARESRESGGDYTKRPEGAGRTADVQIEVDKLMVDESRIRASIADILSKEERETLAFLQSMTTAPTTTEITAEPLNNIGTKLDAILTALQTREPQPITISPTIKNDLGGAYVFDDALKKSLVDDITSDIVTAIKDAVKQATNRASYGYGG